MSGCESTHSYLCQEKEGEIVSKIENMIWDVAKPIAENAGCSLYDVEFVKEGTNWFLRVTIDKPGGVSTDDCESVSRPLSDWLDEKDPITQSYYLEVSSPGIDRKLTRPKHYEDNLGKLVTVRLFAAIDGQRQLEGILKEYQNGTFVLETNESTITLEKAKVVDVRLAWQENE